MQNNKSSVFQQISPKELSVIAGEAVLIDVRSPIEFQTEHIANSINVPLDDLEARGEELPRQGQLVVICRTGNRAQRGAHTLLGRGFQPRVLEGGLVAWRKVGLPLEEGKKMLPIERQIQLIVGLGVLIGVLLSVFINPWFLVIPAFLGAGLTFAGLSGTCALGIMLSKAPWNRLDMPSALQERQTNCCSK